MKLNKASAFMAAIFCSVFSSAFPINTDGNVQSDVEEYRFRTSTALNVNFFDISFLESETTQLDHKYYLSVSNVKYNQKSKALQMVSRFFIDDLEDVLNERMDKKVTLGNADGLEDLKPILNRYISNRLRVKVDGSSVEPNVIGAEYDADQIIVYIELPVANQPKSVEVSYKALFELFPDQKNLVHFKIGDKRKSLLNSMDTPTDRVNF
ncbi:hypothetical protein SAMN05192588_2705 [Nonlabens sp. Hel1_33_55]|uniref:DUF6702 family protein n=1 Tax=Nonlabens sp. Hel1_33_55 TaxID=1336802 RepID=UPI000875ADCB|nr:DUF6702 family protein [Nonlabens sp. Hel1_33_55]SCY40530.1 hypothetical protein SAMN05192588_2705 [Nonlabens sp. Hel1_33_55]